MPKYKVCGGLPRENVEIYGGPDYSMPIEAPGPLAAITKFFQEAARLPGNPEVKDFISVSVVDEDYERRRDIERKRATLANIDMDSLVKLVGDFKEAERRVDPLAGVLQDRPEEEPTGDDPEISIADTVAASQAPGEEAGPPAPPPPKPEPPLSST